MHSSGIHPERIQKLNNCEIRNGSFVLYWMQASQRTVFNHALNFAIHQANKLNLPLITVFFLVENFPSANFRHFKFMLDGLAVTARELIRSGSGFYAAKTQSPSDAFAKIAKNTAIAIVDRGYTRIQKKWRAEAGKILKIPLFQVESDVIVPVEIASAKEEFSAATLRPKIQKLKEKFLTEKFSRPKLIKSFSEFAGKIANTQSIDYDVLKKTLAASLRTELLIYESDAPNARGQNLDETLKSLKIDRSVSEGSFRGGYGEAKKILKIFINEKLPLYAKFARDPSQNVLSNLSPYLHFGQISPLEIAQEVLNSEHRADEFLEELIVRRELAINFVHYNQDYDNFNCIPDWAKESLAKHVKDKRQYIYSENELERAETHDSYWNACQREMLKTGKMHSYMRMYWGKKVIEWTKSPEEAYEILVKLNDKYELDGRDPNGYAGIAWCFGKHDHPWQERNILGKIRYMNAQGLERKFNIKKYLQKY